MRKTIFFAAILFFETSISYLAGGTEANFIVAEKINKALVIDGMLNDDCWKKAAKTGPFSVLSRPHPTVAGQLIGPEEKFLTNAATAQICHDDKYIYVAFHAPAPNDVPAEAKLTEHDSPVWQDDCVELFIDPLRNGGFYQVVVNAMGTVADYRSSPQGQLDKNWNSGAIAKANKNGAGFDVEMAIPFSGLGEATHMAGTGWGINFAREGRSCGGLSTWADVGANFSNTRKYGLLIFGSQQAYLEKELDIIEQELKTFSTERPPELTELTKRISSLKTRIQTNGDDKSRFLEFCSMIKEIKGCQRQI